MTHQSSSSSNPGILLLRLLRLFYLEPLNEDVINFDGLSVGQRILAILGYVTFFGLLLMVLVLELLQSWLPKASFLAGEKLVEVPIPAVLVACLAFCLGWAYLLTGATDARKRVFIPIWMLFGLQIFMVMPLGSTFGMAMWCLGGPFTLFGIGGIYFLSRKWNGWRDWPLAEFTAWFVLFAVFFLGFAISSPEFGRFAHDMAGMFSLLAFFSVPFWLFSGATIVELAVSLAAKVTLRLRHKLSADILRAGATAYTLARPGIVIALLGVLYFVAPDFQFLAMALAVDLGFAILFALSLPVAALVKGLTPRVAAILLTLNLASPIFAISMVMTLASQELDVLELTIGLLAGILPLMIFVFLIAHTLLSVGAEFANGDGKIIPRSGRIQIMFGASLLVIAFTIFFVNLRYIGTGELSSEIQNLTDSLFSLGAFIFGLPYLAWMTWKHADDLAGAEIDFPTPANAPKPRRTVILIAAGLGLLFSLCSCGLIFGLDQLLK